MLRRSFLIFILVSTFALMGCKISGIITDENGDRLKGITVVLSGDASRSTSTNAKGAYFFWKLKRGTYTVTPEDDEYAFDPVSEDVKICRKKKLARVNFVAVTSTPPPLPPTSLPPWSTYQGNAAHTGYVPGWLYPDSFSEEPIWIQNIIESVPLNPVAAGDGKIFVTTAGTNDNDDDGPNLAVALDSTGTELWRHDFNESDPTGPVDFINPPAYANDTVYIQSGGGLDDSFLLAFDAISGEALSFARYENQYFRYYAPTVYDDEVYVGSGYQLGAYAYGFVGVDLTELWSVELSNSDRWTPAVDEDRVITYTGTFGISAGDYFDAELTVIDRSHPNGQVEFSIPDENFKPDLTLENHLNLAPILGSQNNVIVIQGGRLINFDLIGEDIGWERPKEEGVAEGFSGQPSLDPDKGIIYAVYDGVLHAFNESDGTSIDDWGPWPPDNETISETISAPMIVTDNLIFVSTESNTYAVDRMNPNENEPWSYPAGGQLALSDTVLLLIATTDGRLIAIDLLNN